MAIENLNPHETTKCKSCKAEIYFLNTKNNKLIPVNAETVQEGETTFDKTKGHIAHWASCPDALKFRRKK